MIQKTFEIAISLVLIVTTLAFALATGSFMVVSIGVLTHKTFGSMNNLLVSLFMIFVTGLLFVGNLKAFRSWNGFWQVNDADEDELEAGTGSRSTARVLQTKKGSTSAN